MRCHFNVLLNLFFFCVLFGQNFETNFYVFFFVVGTVNLIVQVSSRVLQFDSIRTAFYDIIYCDGLPSHLSTISVGNWNGDKRTLQCDSNQEKNERERYKKTQRRRRRRQLPNLLHRCHRRRRRVHTFWPCVDRICEIEHTMFSFFQFVLLCSISVPLRAPVWPLFRCKICILQNKLKTQ